jgi:hypothetical protein
MCAESGMHTRTTCLLSERALKSHFGAAYGASALLHLIRGGVDAEMLWTGTDDACGYGVLDSNAVPTPLFYARRLCAQYIRRGDTIVLRALPDSARGLDGMAVQGACGRESTLLAHREPTTATYHVSDLTGDRIDGSTVIKIDQESGDTVRTRTGDGTVTFAGYGVAVLTNAIAGCDIGSNAEWT